MHAAPLGVASTPSATMTWGEICSAFPNQWVGLVNVVKNSEMPHDVRTARVVSFGESPADVLRELRPFRTQDAHARHLFTGLLRAPRRHDREPDQSSGFIVGEASRRSS